MVEKSAERSYVAMGVAPVKTSGAPRIASPTLQARRDTLLCEFVFIFILPTYYFVCGGSVKDESSEPSALRLVP